MTTSASDLRYGRQGGRLTDLPTDRAAWHSGMPCKPEPTEPDELRPHLRGLHGVPAEVLDRHTPREWASWHGAEHRTRHPKAREPMHAGHLRHTHPPYLPAKAARS